MTLFEKSIVLAATFLLIIIFIRYLGISIKNPNIEKLTNNKNYDIKILENIQNQLNNMKKQLNNIQKQVKNNTKGVNDYLKNKKLLIQATKN
jgi:peptidoglycan hydrolase CwlO-like protein